MTVLYPWALRGSLSLPPFTRVLLWLSQSQRRKLRQLAERRARQRSGQGWGRGRGMEGLVSVETLERVRGG